MIKIAVLGQQCSGKTTVCQTLNELCFSKHGKFIKFAGPIYGALSALKREKCRGFMQEFGDLSKKYFGEHVFVDAFKQAVLEEQKSNFILCDDVRRTYELEAVRGLGFFVVYVHADDDVRKRRAESQGLDFIESHNSETEVPSMRNLADYCIINNDTCSIEEEIKKNLFPAIMEHFNA